MLNLFWYFLIWRIVIRSSTKSFLLFPCSSFYRSLRDVEVDDVRSDDEDDDDEDEDTKED